MRNMECSHEPYLVRCPRAWPVLNKTRHGLLLLVSFSMQGLQLHWYDLLQYPGFGMEVSSINRLCSDQ